MCRQHTINYMYVRYMYQQEPKYCTCGLITPTYMYMSLYTCVHVPTDNVQMSAFSYQSREVSSGEYNTSRVI